MKKNQHMENKSVILIAVFFLALFSSVSFGAVIFSDNFDTGASSQWGNEAGSWVASGGVYYAQSLSNNPLTYTSLPFTLGNFSIDVDISNIRDGGIWLRSSDNAHGVLLVTGGRGGSGTGLYWHIVNGSSNGVSLPIQNEVGGLFTPGVSDPHIRVVVSGDTYSAFVNGGSTPVTTFTTNAFASGRVALYDFSSQTFDNVVLATNTPTTVPVPGALLLGVVGTGLLGRMRRRRVV